MTAKKNDKKKQPTQKLFQEALRRKLKGKAAQKFVYSTLNEGGVED